MIMSLLGSITRNLGITQKVNMDVVRLNHTNISEPVNNFV